MPNSSKSLIGWKTRAALAVIVVLFMIGWRLIVIARQPPHLLDIADEIGSVAQTRVGIYPNSDGSRFIYFQETETGLGTFFYDTAAGKSRLLFEEPEKNYGGHFRMLGWSPDEKLLAYFTTADTNLDGTPRLITLYDGHTGVVVTTVPASAYASDSQFTWLSNHSFVYSTHDHRSWLIFAADAHGKWSETQVIKRFTPGRLPHLTVTSPHSIAWLRSGDIWTFDFVTGASAKIWSANDTNKVVSFSYSQNSDNYSLNCVDNEGRLTMTYRPPNAFYKQGAILDTIRNPQRTRYADLQMGQGHYVFTIKLDTNSTPSTFVWDGMLHYHALGGNRLFFAGNPLDGIPGIWEYDVKNKTTNCLVSGLKDGLKYAKMVTPTDGLITNTSGKQISYQLWRPARMIPGKKYPVILGEGIYSWNSFAQVAPNGGFYFASTDLVDWTVRDWADDMVHLYETLAQNNPSIDTNRVYLIAYSAQNFMVNQALALKPDFFRGLILFYPVDFPDLTYRSPFNVFVIGGTDDPSSPVDKLIKFQDDVAKLGLPVRLVLQNGAQHIARSITTERDQTHQFARFLIENQN